MSHTAFAARGILLVYRDHHYFYHILSPSTSITLFISIHHQQLFHLHHAASTVLGCFGLSLKILNKS